MILTWQDPSVFPGQGTARFYVDGILVGSSAQTEDGGDGIVNDGFVIGSEPEELLRYFSGAIGELRFYDSIQDAAAVPDELTEVAPEVFDVNLRTFPGLGYVLQSSPTPSTGYLNITASAFIATNHTQTLKVAPAPGRTFIRAKRN